MANETSRVLTIASLERLKLSTNGNPRFRVTFTDGTVAQTQTDASIGYSIENSEFRDVPVRVSFTRAGRIFDVETIKADSIQYDIPDVEPNEETGLSVWPVYVNGARIGEITETLEGYRASAPLWSGRELSFRQSAIEDLQQHFEGRD
jgi:hypothetical protein